MGVQEAEAAKNIMQFLRAVRVTVVLTKVDEGEFRNKFEQEQDGLLVQLRLIFPNCRMLTSGIGNFDAEIAKQMVPADSKASAAPAPPTAPQAPAALPTEAPAAAIAVAKALAPAVVAAVAQTPNVESPEKVLSNAATPVDKEALAAATAKELVKTATSKAIAKMLAAEKATTAPSEVNSAVVG